MNFSPDSKGIRSTVNVSFHFNQISKNFVINNAGISFLTYLSRDSLTLFSHSALLAEFKLKTTNIILREKSFHVGESRPTFLTFLS